MPSHPSPRVLGEVRRQRSLEKWETTDRACGEPGLFLFQILESQISRTYLKQKLFSKFCSSSYFKIPLN